MAIGPDDPSERARSFAADQVRRLHELGPAAADGDDDAVHDARTATRRLRTALSLCGPLLPAPDRMVRTGLRELGQALGAVRDPLVQLAWLRDALASRTDDDPRALARLEEDRTATRQAGLDALRRLLRSPGHAHLMAELDGLVAVVWQPDDGRIARRSRREWRALDRELAAADAAAPDERDAALHAARRQARRTRYAYEVVGGDDAMRSAALAERLQETLGRQHDAVLVRAVIGRVAAAADAAGEDTSAYRWLDRRAAHAADRAIRAAGRAATRARDQGHRLRPR